MCHKIDPKLAEIDPKTAEIDPKTAGKWMDFIQVDRSRHSDIRLGTLKHSANCIEGGHNAQHAWSPQIVDFVFKIMDFVFKIMDFVFKMMNFVAPNHPMIKRDGHFSVQNLHFHGGRACTFLLKNLHLDGGNLIRRGSRSFRRGLRPTGQSDPNRSK